MPTLQTHAEPCKCHGMDFSTPYTLPELPTRCCACGGKLRLVYNGMGSADFSCDVCRLAVYAEPEVDYAAEIYRRIFNVHVYHA